MAKRLFVVIGDWTTHGGRVVSASGNMSIDGKKMARVDDLVFCPKCKGTFKILTGADGPPFVLVDKPAARDGDVTACGASLIAGGQTLSAWSNEGSPGPSYGAPTSDSATDAFDDEATPKDAYDRHFILVDEETGTRIEGMEYALEADSGERLATETSADGCTGRVGASSPEIIKLKIEDEEGRWQSAPSL